MSEDWRSLHEALFPLDDRQLAALDGRAQGDARGRLCSLQGEVVRSIWWRARELGAGRAVRDWLRLDEYPAAANLLSALARSPMPVGHRAFDATSSAAGAIGDAYERWLHPDLRHRLGEHYTPPGLVRLVIDGGIEGLVCDPSCGDGRFLVAALATGAEHVAGSE